MRLLIDEYQFIWDEAFGGLPFFSYTNHTLMSEALGALWPVDMLGKLPTTFTDYLPEVVSYFRKRRREPY